MFEPKIKKKKKFGCKGRELMVTGSVDMYNLLQKKLRTIK